MAAVQAADAGPLNRSLGLWLTTLYGLGTTIGAGIYVLVGTIAGEAGHLAPWSFVVAALIAGLAAGCFAQLAKRHPKSAGEAHYVLVAFERWSC
jgi:APA family basic amino acid/polyamine antiporter